MRRFPDRYSDMRIWHWDGRVNRRYRPGAIPKEFVKRDAFVFLGKRQRIMDCDYELVLNDFDRLLRLYTFVEGNGRSPRVAVSPDGDFVYCQGLHRRKRAAITVQAQKHYDLVFRHNELQVALYRRLKRRYGDVGTECGGSRGTKVDVVLPRENGAYWLYEIKTADTPRGCIREAIGQLMEYAYWPGGPNVTRLIVGESKLDKDGAKYLQAAVFAPYRIRTTYNLNPVAACRPCSSPSLRSIAK